MYNKFTKGVIYLFEKYNINDLYIADINVAYPDPKEKVGMKVWDNL